MISILMPVRSGWQYIFEATDSVRVQTYSNWELLIGVNGLPAHSVPFRIASCLGYVDSRIRGFQWPECPNKPAALNQLMIHAKGDCIAMLDVDDLWLPDKLKKQVSFIGDYDVVGTLGERFGTQLGRIELLGGEVSFDDLLARNHMLNSAVLMRRELAAWDEVGLLDDYPLWLKLAHEGRTFYNVPEVLTRIRSHPDQWYGSGRDNSIAIRQEWAAKA